MLELTKFTALSLRRLAPKLRLQSQLEHALNQTADVVAKYFAKCLVDLRPLRFASQKVAELRLDHVERRFDIRAFVVALHKPLLVVRVEVKHALEKIARLGIAPRAVHFERNVRHGVSVHNCLEVLT